MDAGRDAVVVLERLGSLLEQAARLLDDPVMATPTAAALEALTALHRERALDRFQLRLVYPPGTTASDIHRPTVARTMRA